MGDPGDCECQLREFQHVVQYDWSDLPCYNYRQWMVFTAPVSSDLNKVPVSTSSGDQKWNRRKRLI